MSTPTAYMFPSTGHGYPIWRKRRRKLGIIRKRMRSSMGTGFILMVCGITGGLLAMVDSGVRHPPPDPPDDASAPQLALYVLAEGPPFAAATLLLCLGYWGIAVVHRVSKLRKWNGLWLLFIWGSVAPVLAYLMPWQRFGEFTSMEWPRLLALCLCCSTAQAVFGWQAWLLRRHSVLSAWEGSRSGLVFFGITYPAMLGYVVFAPLLEGNWRDAFNGEVWALLGAAQFIVALTNGIAERKAFQRETHLQAILKQQQVPEPAAASQRRKMPRYRPDLRWKRSSRRSPLA